MNDKISSQTDIPHSNSFKPAPSRNGRNGERSKVTQACDQCRKGKSRCSGNMPCTNCVYDKKACSYNRDYTRGRRTKILPNPNYKPDPQHKVFVGGSGLDNSGSSKEREAAQMSPGLGSSDENLSANQMMSQPQQSASNSPITNLFQEAQHRFDQDAPVSVLAHGDLPMPISQPGLVTLPSPDDGAKLVQIYFGKFSPSILFLHRPSVESWTEELLEVGGNLLQKHYLRSRNAVVFMIFASAQTYSAKSELLDISMLSCQLADEQLKSETGPPQLTSVQARLLQCYYLIARGRINQCWSTFSNVISLIFILELQRSHSKRGVVDLIEMECQKRVFWAAFYLDKFLSCALDRPQRLKVNDIDQELPKILNDRQFTPNNLVPASLDDLSTNLASNLQIELSIITSNILDQFYGFHKLAPDEHYNLVQSYLTNTFPAWKKKGASLIHANSGSLNEVQNRQRSELWLSYHHTKILLLRTFLLVPECDNAEDGMMGALTDACKYICEMVEPQPKGFVKEDAGTIFKHEFQIYADFVNSVAFRCAWFPQYIISTAATVIYITGAQNPAQVCKPDNTIMRKIQILHTPLKKIAFPGTFMGLCVSVLDELKIAVDDAIERRSSKSDDAKNEEGGSAEERENLRRYLMMARQKLEEGGEDLGVDGDGYGDVGMGMELWRDGLRADRDRPDVMNRFRLWGFARLTNRIMECGW